MNLKRLLLCMNYEHLESTGKSLLFLRNFLGFTWKRNGKQIGNLRDLEKHAEFRVRNISCLLYLCPVYFNFNVNDPMVNDWKMQFSSELLNFSPEQATTREIRSYPMQLWMNLIWSSQRLSSVSQLVTEIKSHTCTRKFEFSPSVSQCLTHLSRTDPGLAPKYLLSFSNYFQEHISGIIIDMGCLIYALYNDDKTWMVQAMS